MSSRKGADRLAGRERKVCMDGAGMPYVRKRAEGLAAARGYALCSSRTKRRKDFST